MSSDHITRAYTGGGEAILSQGSNWLLEQGAWVWHQFQLWYVGKGSLLLELGERVFVKLLCVFILRVATSAKLKNVRYLVRKNHFTFKLIYFKTR